MFPFFAFFGFQYKILFETDILITIIGIGDVLLDICDTTIDISDITNDISNITIDTGDATYGSRMHKMGVQVFILCNTQICGSGNTTISSDDT